MKDVHRFFERRQVEHSVGELRANPNLAHTWTDAGHRLPVVGIESLLHLAQLKAASPSRVRRKSADVATRRRQPGERLVRHELVYKFLYRLSISGRPLRGGGL